MSGFTAAGISPSTVTTTQQAPLGVELSVPNGDKGLLPYIYVHNDSGSLIETAMVVSAKIAATRLPRSRRTR